MLYLIHLHQVINALAVIPGGLTTNDLLYTPTLGDQGTHYSCIRPDDLMTTNALTCIHLD